MVVEIFSRPNLHETNVPDVGVDLGTACIPSGLVTDLATAPGLCSSNKGDFIFLT